MPPPPLLLLPPRRRVPGILALVEGAEERDVHSGAGWAGPVHAARGVGSEGAACLYRRREGVSGTMEYIRRIYGVPAKRGMRVIAYGKPGVITSARGPHLMVRLDDYKYPLPYHPEDIKYPFWDGATFVCGSIWHTCEESGVCPVCDGEAKS